MEPFESLTVRFPAHLLAVARGVQKEDESLNDFIVDAVERELRRRGLEACDDILRIREKIRAEHGIHPDSTPYIRELREERASRG